MCYRQVIHKNHIFCLYSYLDMADLNMASNYLLYECNNFLLLDKPHNMPTVPLKTQDIGGTLLEQAALICPAVLEVKGKNPWEGGALHRLDTATAGLVLFAKTQSFYNYMQESQKNNLFEKYYLASTFKNDSLKGYDIEEKAGNLVISSYFRPYGPKSKEVRPTLDINKARPKILYTTSLLREENLFCCTITKGFRHQLRAHLAWTGHPIIGDSLYANLQVKGEPVESLEPLQLECVGVSFPMQEEGKKRFYVFRKRAYSDLVFPSLSRFANKGGNVIIQL